MKVNCALRTNGVTSGFVCDPQKENVPFLIISKVKSNFKVLKIVTKK